MKKKLFHGKGGRLFFAFCCILMALVFWFLVKYNQILDPVAVMFIHS